MLITLMELAARLEGDGSLPGKDSKERVLCTMVALLCFLSQDGAASKGGPFSRHLVLMTEFLALASLPAWGEAFERIKQRVLEKRAEFARQRGRARKGKEYPDVPTIA